MHRPLASELLQHLSSLVGLTPGSLTDNCIPSTNHIVTDSTYSRIDLNPPKADENDEQEGENTEHHTEETAAVEDSATPIADGTQSHHYHHRLTNYLHNPLNVRRILDATVEERLATLRHIRQAIPGEGARDEDTATRAGRNPLSMRLFERFRIRTRAHGIEASSPAVNSISTLTVPPPAHLAGSSTLESIT